VRELEMELDLKRRRGTDREREKEDFMVGANMLTGTRRTAKGAMKNAFDSTRCEEQVGSRRRVRCLMSDGFDVVQL